MLQHPTSLRVADSSCSDSTPEATAIASSLRSLTPEKVVALAVYSIDCALTSPDLFVDIRFTDFVPEIEQVDSLSTLDRLDLGISLLNGLRQNLLQE